MTVTLHAPQIILLVFCVIEIIAATVWHGDPRPPTSVWTTLLNLSLIIALLYWGGFFN